MLWCQIITSSESGCLDAPIETHSILREPPTCKPLEAVKMGADWSGVKSPLRPLNLKPLCAPTRSNLFLPLRSTTRSTLRSHALVCVCVHMYMYVCVHMYMYVCVHIYVYVHRAQENSTSDDDDDDDEERFSSSSCLVLPQMPVTSHWTPTRPTDDSLCLRTTGR